MSQPAKTFWPGVKGGELVKASFLLPDPPRFSPVLAQQLISSSRGRKKPSFHRPFVLIVLRPLIQKGVACVKTRDACKAKGRPFFVSGEKALKKGNRKGKHSSSLAPPTQDGRWHFGVASSIPFPRLGCIYSIVALILLPLA